MLISVVRVPKILPILHGAGYILWSTGIKELMFVLKYNAAEADARGGGGVRYAVLFSFSHEQS